MEEAMYSGFHTSVTETPAVLRGTYPVNADGSVTLTIPDALFESAYKVTVSQSTATSAALPALTGTASMRQSWRSSPAAHLPPTRPPIPPTICPAAAAAPWICPPARP